MTSYVVGSGQTSSGVTLGISDTLVVSSGGTSSSTTANGSHGIDLPSPSTITVSSGGSADNTRVYGYAFVTVLSGGLTTGDFASSDGEEVVSSGGTALAPVIDGYGLQSVYGSVTGTVVMLSGQSFIRSGGVASNSVVTGGTAYVSFGGTATDTSVLNLGAVSVESGGTADGVALDENGLLFVSPGAVVTGLSVFNGGIVYLESTAGVTGVVSSGGTIEINNSAIAPGISSSFQPGMQIGGLQVSLGANLAIGYTSVGSGGSLIVQGATEIYGTSVGAAASDVISSGAQASNTALMPGSIERVYAGGTADYSVVSSGAQQILSGGQSDYTRVYGSGVEQVLGGSFANATTLSAGSLIVAGGTYSVLDFGNVTVLSGGTASATTVSPIPYLVPGTGILTVAAGGTANATIVSSGGVQTISAGGQASGTTILHGGTESNFGTVVGTTVQAGGTETGAGVFTSTVINGGTVIVAAGGSATHTMVKAGTLAFHLPQPGSPSGIVNTSVTAGGTLDALDNAFISGGSATLDTNDLLTVTEGGQTAFTLQLSGTYTNEYFHLAADSGTGTSITLDNVPCYCHGTQILTDHGEVPVEHLQIGDVLLTHNGAPRPIRWIGRRSYDGRFAAGNRDVLPVRIHAHALDDNIPHRDLLVSPLHALFLDGVLIPAAALVNGSSIVQLEAVDQVHYVHLELDTHDVILAEGAPAETFVDDQSRNMFHNAPEYTALYPGAPTPPAQYCAPRLEHGEHLEAIRQKLAGRIAPTTTEPGPLAGRIEHLDRGRIAGWARDTANPTHPVTLRFRDNGVVIASITADGIRRGRPCAFDLTIPGGLDPDIPHTIQAERLSDAAPLPGPPTHLAALPRPTTPPQNLVEPGCGFLDAATPGRINGWIHDPPLPRHPHRHPDHRQRQNDRPHPRQPLPRRPPRRRHRRRPPQLRPHHPQPPLPPRRPRHPGRPRTRRRRTRRLPHPHPPHHPLRPRPPTRRHPGPRRHRPTRPSPGLHPEPSRKSSPSRRKTQSRLMPPRRNPRPDANPPAVIQTPDSTPVRWGYLDIATRDRIKGWLHDPRSPSIPVAVQIIDNGVPIARILANRYRADLDESGIGRGRHSFDLAIPAGLSPHHQHIIQARRETDGAELNGSPVIIPAASAFDATLERTLATATATLAANERPHALAYMLEQADRLRQRQADTASGRDTRHTAPREAPRRALIIDQQAPTPGHDAGSQAILSHIRALVRLGYAVSFANGSMHATPASCAALEAAGALFLGAPAYTTVEDVLRRQADCWDVVYLHRAETAGRYMMLARAHAQRARILYSVADLHHLRIERQATVEDRPELLSTARRMRLVECTAAWSADAVITHSHTEAAWLRRAVPEANVHQVPWDIPRPDARPDAQGSNARRTEPRRAGVAFIGGYDHAPNRDAAQWLVEAVMPLVWSARPTIPCLLVGPDMPGTLRRLAGPQVELLGHVEDLATIWARVRLTAAPLRYGAGIKGKVLESLAAGIPCIMTPEAADGLTLPPALLALIGDTPAALAALIVRLHATPAEHRAAATAGLSFMRDHFTPVAVDAALRAAIEGIPAAVRAA